MQSHPALKAVSATTYRAARTCRAARGPFVRRGFTLVELLVVIAIIGVLISLLLPAIQAAREAARRSQCANNLMQLIVAVQSYESVHEAYPPGSIDPADPIQNLPKGYHMGWLVQILPFIEQNNTFKHIDFSVGVYHKKNAPVRTLTLPLLACPSDSAGGGGGATAGYSNYAACHHDVEAPISQSNNGVFFLNSHVRYDQITDGSSHTIFLGEKQIEPVELGWMTGTRSTLRNTGTLPNGTVPIIAGAPGGAPDKGPDEPSADEPASDAASDDPASDDLADEGIAEDSADEAEVAGEFAQGDFPEDPGLPGGAMPGARQPPAAATFVGGFSSRHPAGANFAFGDGRIQFLFNGISATVYQQLGHRADGKLLSGY